MEKKTIYKIGAILVILALLVPVIATATEPTFKSMKKSFNYKSTPILVSRVEEPSLGMTEQTMKEMISDTASLSKHNMVGKWGLYTSFLDDRFVAQKEGNNIFGRIHTSNHYTYFYIVISSEPELSVTCSALSSGTFEGAVFDEGDFYSISGDYITKQGKFSAMWEMSNDLEGWFVGKLI